MSNNKEWFYVEKGEKKGPVSEVEMIELIKTAIISYGTLVWTKDFSEWQKIDNTDLIKYVQEISPPPINPVKDVGSAYFHRLLDKKPLNFHNYFAWGMVVTMLANMLFGLLRSGFNVWITLISVLLVLGLNCFLAYLDMNVIERAGLGKMNFRWSLIWAAIFPPVYLYRRASQSKQKPIQFYAAIVCMLLSLVVSALVMPNRLTESTAASLITENLVENNFDAKCVRVKITKKISDRMYSAIAYLDNGKALNVTIIKNGFDIEVRAQ